MNNQYYSPQGFSILPPVVKNILIINGLFFLATIALQNGFGIDLSDTLGLHYFASQKFNPYQFITYMFMHGGVSHIFFNMFALWMFGYALENVWGSKRFLIYYLITGIGAALIHYVIFYFEFNPIVQALDEIINNPGYGNLAALSEALDGKLSPYTGEIFLKFQEFQMNLKRLHNQPENMAAFEAAKGFVIDYKEYVLNRPNVIGASGAVFGILLAFGMLFPNTLLYIYFMIPVKAKWVVIAYGALELYMGFTNSDSNVAHFAHLGGMIFGFFLIKFWKQKGIY